MSKKYVAIRMRGEIGIAKKKLDTLRIMGLKKKYSALIFDEKTVMMIKTVNNLVAWGEASEETASYIGKHKSLKPPKSGVRSIKFLYPKGSVGFHGEKINDLVKKMM